MKSLVALRLSPLAALLLVAACQSLSKPSNSQLIDCAASNQVSVDRFHAQSERLAANGVQMNVNLASAIPIQNTKIARELLLERGEFQSSSLPNNDKLESAIAERKPYWASIDSRALNKKNRKCNRILYR